MHDPDVTRSQPAADGRERLPLFAPGRAYRILLLAFPRRFRTLYALDLLELYADMRRSPHRRRGRPPS